LSGLPADDVSAAVDGDRLKLLEQRLAALEVPAAKETAVGA
jgi:hypothetical protein